ncbi:MAG: iron ABC transporter permease, partial [Desulfatiglandaceae bacterium]
MRKFLMLSAIMLLIVLVVYPLYSLIIRAFVSYGRLSLDNFYEIFQNKQNYVALYHSLFVSLISTAIATTLGAVLAWIVGRTNIPYRGTLRTALVMPFIIPPFITAMAWLQLLGPAGYINTIYMDLTGSWDPLFVIYGKWAIILVMTLSGYPFVFLTTLGGLERMNPELEEAAQNSGSGTFKVMRDITLPLMAPTIAAGSLLVFVSRIANFGIAAVMGMPENYYVLTTKIYRLIDQSFVVENAQEVATAMSVLLVVIAGAGLIGAKVYLRGKQYTVISGKDVQPKIVELVRSRHLLFGFCLFIVLVSTVLPVLAMVFTALTKAYGLPPVISNWTLDNFHYVLIELQMTKRAIRNSFFLAVSASTVTVFSGLIIAYIVVKTQTKGKQLLDITASMPYSVPGTVFALGMILAWNKEFFGSFSIYNTIWILLAAYIARYMAHAVRTTSASLAQIHDSHEEAGRISGARWTQSFRDIVLPLVRPGIFAGWFIIFMPALRELTISVLLWSAGNETLGVAVYNLQEGGDV